MNVVYGANEGYAQHLAVSMTSLMDRNRDADEIQVFVLSMGITEESREKLAEIGKRYGRDVCFLELADVKERFGREADTRGFDISAMGRLFMGSLLPAEAERVLYLDCDTVVLRSLKRLWETDLRGKVLGAVMEPTIYEPVKQEIGLGENDFYVNSGVLLLDLARWRRQEVEKRLLDYFQEKNGRLFACDQDTINGALRGEILPLPPQYNFFSNYRYFRYRTLVKWSPSYGRVSREDFQRAKAHPAILHYAGDERPWIRGNRNYYRRAYEKYLALTPWAATPKEKGRELYMLAYHLMNLMTVVCPSLRRQISRGFGMRVVDSRAAGAGRGERRESRKAEK